MKAKKKVSVIARGKLAKSAVFSGKKAKTLTGLTKESLIKSKTGKIITKKASAHAKKLFQSGANGAKKWGEAVKQARAALGIKGFCAVGGKSAQGKALYAKAKAIAGK